MKPVQLNVARIGNSRGVRIPAATLARYQIGTEVVMEERSDGILLRPPGPASLKLSWEDTALEMAAAAEDWSEWDGTSTDGLDGAPWEPVKSRHVAEQNPKYEARRRLQKHSSKR
ncbi:MAG: AbrB/MazE/SpoVT family DNA-binding domain-containing protein [Gemmatimonadales bacterium]|nr:AbrB/MazE/SpoVT family DNA-binding domain-containing protein [Gemmatimonadales bacterium]MDQ3426693.1 AbrB/MazE/SpoVT family DNA-binding domain-containing protein [Gemmatimonadota bacterium]